MNQAIVSLFAISILLVAGCDSHPTNKKSDVITPAAPLIAKNLTLEEKFLETKKKAEAGDAKAQYILGLMYGKGDGVSNNSVTAAQWIKKSADQGYIEAQTRLGTMYCSGSVVVKDSAKAIALLEKSSESGDNLAQWELGEIYRPGEDKFEKLMKEKTGCAKTDASKSDSWFRKAAIGFQVLADKGDADSQLTLGNMYIYGRGVSTDISKGVGLIQQAADRNFAPAQSELGRMYEKGEKVRKDALNAVELYKKAAAQGDVGAQTSLGSMYKNGEGIPKDAVKAFEYFQKAAAQGDSVGQFLLGRQLEDGEGTSINLVAAYAWYNLAAATLDVDIFKDARNRVEAVLSPSLRAEGQRLASNWKKGGTIVSANSNPSVTVTPSNKPVKQSSATAFFISSDGHALTNYHVINGCTEVKVAGRDGAIKVITSDSVNDLALLQLSGKTNDIATFTPDLRKLRQGDDIIVFGYPLNSVLSSGGNLTLGTISALSGLGNNTNQIQITAPIQPGSSGSPVIDKKGNVVGVASMKLSDSNMARATGSIGQNVNFAVNGQTVKAFLDANKVSYKSGGGFFSREMSNSDIADEARKYTLLVECWK